MIHRLIEKKILEYIFLTQHLFLVSIILIRIIKLLKCSSE